MFLHLPIKLNFVISFCLLVMNMLIWNCRGALSPTFCNVISDMVRVHSPTIMIIIETKVCGDRAKMIADKLKIFANSIGFSGGLWVLWDFGQVEVIELM